MNIVSWRRVNPHTAIIIAAGCLGVIYIIYSLNKTVDLSTLTRPKYTDFDEYRERRAQGFFDNIPLRDLLIHTELLKHPESPCKSDTEMVILVQSACDHSTRREAIRTTWGKKAVSMGIPVLFFLGQCPNQKDEIKKFDDIVQVNFVDSYYNNTIKSLARYRWFTRECSSARFLLMSDDDAMIIIDHLYNFLKKGMGYSIIGPYYYPGSRAIRYKTSKWYVPYWLWPASTYPEYIGGGTYVVNGSIVQSIYDLSLQTAFISIDDMLFTGIVAGMLGVHRVKDNRFPKRKYTFISCGESSIFASQSFTPDEILSYWSRRTERCK